MAMSSCSAQLSLLTGATVTPVMVTGMLRAYAVDSALVPTVDFPSAKICVQKLVNMMITVGYDIEDTRKKSVNNKWGLTYW